MKVSRFTKHWVGVIALFPLIMSMFGCTGIYTHPLAARAGDTITFAVGSADGMTAANTSVTVTPNGGSAITVPIRNIFKLYPDPRSAAWLNNGNTASIETNTGHGPWTDIIAAELPLTYPDGTTPLQTGPAVIHVTTTATYSSLTTHVNNVPINIEILPGTGHRNDFEYELLNGVTDQDRLGDLEPIGGLTVKPAFTGTSSTTYGAISVSVTIPYSDGIAESAISVLMDEKVGQAKSRRSSYFWSKNGPTITVNIISPQGTLEYFDAQIDIVSSNIKSLVDSGLVIPGASGNVTTSVTYYDVNGNPVSGPTLGSQAMI